MNTPELFCFDNLILLSGDKYSEFCIGNFLKEFPMTKFKDPLNLEKMPDSIINVTNINFVDVNQDDNQLLWRCMQKNELKGLSNKTCYFFIIFEIKGVEIFVHSIAYKPELKEELQSLAKTYIRKYRNCCETDMSYDKIEKNQFDLELIQELAPKTEEKTETGPKDTSVMLHNLEG